MPTMPNNSETTMDSNIQMEIIHTFKTTKTTLSIQTMAKDQIMDLAQAMDLVQAMVTDQMAARIKMEGISSI